MKDICEKVTPEQIEAFKACLEGQETNDIGLIVTALFLGAIFLIISWVITQI